MASVTMVERKRASAAAVANRKACRRLRNAKGGGKMRDPVAIRIALELNQKSRKQTDAARLRMQRLQRIFDQWRHVQIDQGVIAGELRYVWFSFTCWLLEVRCGWPVAAMAPADAGRCWTWWLGLHPIEQLQIVRQNRDFR